MNAEQFCAEYGKETISGRITFPKRKVDKFIETYTHLKPSDFTKEMRTRLVVGVMIDLHKVGSNRFAHVKELPEEKIELPDFVFGIKN